jgi:cell division protein ZapA
MKYSILVLLIYIMRSSLRSWYVLSQKNKVEVRIAGKDYSLVGFESDEYIQKVGLYIDRKMNEILKVNNKLSTSMAAVLTAINVTDDLFKTQQNEQKLKGELEKTSDDIKKLTGDNKKLSAANTELADKNTTLQLELAKREAELREVRNSLEKLDGKY